jgi:hypothetical protein
MWAHYAGNYTGVCFAYLARRLIDSLPQKTFLARLSYVDEPPLVYPSHARDVSVAARRILSQKQYHWSYEREWRLLADVGPVHYESDHALCAIYFGSRISTYNRAKLLSAIRGLNVDAHQMVITDYRMWWKRMKLTTGTSRKSLTARKR